jgi:deoxycytidylate deaminase
VGKHAITAIIFDKRNRPISVGTNDYLRSHPLQKKCAEAVGEPDRIFIHAEIAALVRLKDWSRADSILVTRYTKDGKPANAKPCRACQHALALAGINRIRHT